MRNIYKNIAGLLPAILLMSSLSACGKSGTNNSQPQQADPKPYGNGNIVGQIIANGKPVDISGLGIKTATVTGITQHGKFSYNSGEEIEFFLGETHIGKSIANEQIALDSILEADYSIPDKESLLKAHLETGKSNFPLSFKETDLSGIHLLSNKIKLLLILDNDRDYSNGINLYSWNDKLKGTSINLNASLYDNSNFLKIFQNINTPKLFVPTAIDVAEPLYYYHSVLNGKKIEASTIDSLSIPGALKREITFEYDKIGRISKTSVEDKDNTTDQTRNISKTIFKYGKYGAAVETTKFEQENIGSEESTSNFRKKSVEYSGYYHDTGNKLIEIKETIYRGQTESQIQLDEITELTGDLRIPFFITERSYRSFNDDQSSHGGSTKSELDNQGRLLSRTSRAISFDSSNQNIEIINRSKEVLVYSNDQDKLIKTRTVDKADDGHFDGQPEETHTTSVILDNQKRISTCTTSIFDNKENTSKPGTKYQHSYLNNTNNIDNYSFYRDLNTDETYGGAGQETEQWGGLENTRNQQGIIIKQIQTLNSNQKRKFDYMFIEEDGEHFGKIGSIWVTRNKIYQDTVDYFYNGAQLRRVVQKTFRTDQAPRFMLSEIVSNFTYDENGNIKRNFIQNKTANQTIDKVINRSKIEDGIGYLVRQQDNTTLNTSLADDTSWDYRLRVNLPPTASVSSGCVF